MATPEVTSQPVVMAAPAPMPGSVEYYVAPGDSLESVSARFGVSMQSIVDANALEPPFNLTEGQRLSIPPRAEHVVVRGDTVYNISKRYGVAKGDLMRVYNIGPDFKIRLGQTLIIPQPAGSVMVAAAPAVTMTDATVQGGAQHMAPIVSEPATTVGPPMPLAPVQPAPSASRQGVTAVELAPPPAAATAPTPTPTPTTTLAPTPAPTPAPAAK